MSIHPSVGGVTTVHCLIRRSGRTAHYNADLVFIGGVPTVVIDWIEYPDGDRPGVTVPLDPSLLHKIGWDEAEYMYQDTIDDPRQLD